MKGHKNINNVSGYWLMENYLQTNYTHYFYGCDDDTLEKLKHNVEHKHSNAKILGYKAPPFVDIDEITMSEQLSKDFKEINKVKPDFIWIGISSPKQDYLMNFYVNHIDHGVLIGVGAVFLYQAGLINKGPEWIKKLGLRWFVRFIQEPVRMWEKKSIQNSIYFIYLIIKHDILKIKLK